MYLDNTLKCTVNNFIPLAVFIGKKLLSDLQHRKGHPIECPGLKMVLYDYEQS
jgi:hypothetical protein